MRKIVGPVVAFAGAFLIVVAIMAQAYAANRLMKTPIDVSTVTHLSGTATLSGETFPVKVTSTTLSDSAKSDDDVVVWKNSSCVVRADADVPDCVSSDDPQNRLISASVDDFATDRKTGLAVNDPKYLPADAVPHEGLVNKWPFNSEKKDYPYWFGTTGEAITATYDRTQDLEGVECYVYTISVSDVPIEIAEGVDGLYSEETEIYVEPLTGAIQNQVTHQTRTLTDGTPVLDLSIQFTDDQLKSSASDAEDNMSQLQLLTKTVPLVGYIVGIPVFLIGLALVFLSHRRLAAPSDDGTRSDELTPA